MNNIVLTGMPGAGKSTIGVLLAKVLGYKFIDAYSHTEQSGNAAQGDHSKVWR